MKATHQKGGWIAAGALLLVAGALLPGLTSDAAHEDTGARVKPVFAQGLPNAPGKELTAVVVTYAPGGKSPLGDARLAHELLAGKPHKRGKILLVAAE